MRYLFGIVLFFMATSSSHADTAVVVSKLSSVSRLERREVANIFLSKTNSADDGSRVKTLELSDKPYKAAFYRAIAGKTPAQMNSYWTALIFTGRGKPPKNIGSIHRLIEMVTDDIAAIAYIPLEQVTDAVQIVYIVRGVP